MVSTQRKEFGYIIARDSELDELLRASTQTQLQHTDSLTLKSLRVGEVGVLVSLGKTSKLPLRPLALVCHDEDVRRLCGRYAHVRADFSPLTAWCHLLNPAFHMNMDGVVHEPKFANTVAAWSGLIVAETRLLSDRPLRNIRISACLASATYAVSRTLTLWDKLTIESIVERFDAANTLCRGTGAASRDQSRSSRVRAAFVPMWRCLGTLSSDANDPSREELFPLVVALNALQEAKSRSDPNEAGQFAGPLLKAVPEAQDFCQLAQISPESRLKLFDHLVSILRSTDRTAIVRRNALGLAIGYLATVAAGGAASLALVENCSDEFPELTGWAYLVGGIGEPVTWTSGFDGLGRLVARELLRPLRLDEPPTCDFGFDEAIVLADRELKDPLVHLRIKQAKVLSVSLYPGVNVAIPIVDGTALDSTYRDSRELKEAIASEGQTSIIEDPLGSLAHALWPHLKPLVIEEASQRFTAKRRGKAGSPRSRQKGKEDHASQLPLADRRK